MVWKIPYTDGLQALTERSLFFQQTIFGKTISAKMVSAQ
jgi:hypothetical protein